MLFEQTHEMQASLKECLRELVHAVGHLDFELKGNKVLVQDQDRTLVINLKYEGERHLGSLDLPMTEVSYVFIGYNEQEMSEFMKHLSKHLLRAGG